jgi:outer membrane protein OmpA-like peptidoglycan-associated protein
MKLLHWILPVVLVCLAPVATLAQDGEEMSGEMSGEEMMSDEMMSEDVHLDLKSSLCRRQGPTLTGETGLFVLRSGTTLCKGQWAFSTYFNNWDRRTTGIAGRDPLWNDWNYEREQLNVAFGYGVTDRFEIAVSLPYRWYDADEGENGVAPDGTPLLQGGRLHGRTYFGDFELDGVGDLRVAGKYQVVDNPGYKMTINAFVDLPTGDDDEGVVTGETGFGAGFNWSVYDWVFNLGYYTPGDPDFGDVSDQIDLGVGYARPISERFEWISEVVAAIKTEDTGRDGEHDDLDVTTGGRYYFGADRDWAFNFGVRVDLSDDDIGSNYNPIGGLIGLTWSPRRSRDLSTSVAGDCRGRVTTDPKGAHCSSAGVAQDCGREVQLSAAPLDPTCCEFDSWSGDCSGSDPDTVVAMDGDKSCTAHFKKKGPYTLTVEKKVTGDCDGSGSVTSDPAGIDCGGRCSGSFECGTEVALTAKPEVGVTRFEGWTGDPDCQDGRVSMDGDKSCTANFACDVCYEDREQVKAEASCYFESNSNKLDNRCKLDLDQVALAMKEVPDAKVDVVGHSSCTPGVSDDYEIKVSRRRAEAVREYLKKRHQIADDRFVLEPRGCTDAKASDNPRSEKHRRVDVSLTVTARVKVPCQ